MRNHPSPVHEQHAFLQLLRALGPRPELEILATFIKFCRKVYQNGKFLKAYIENVDKKFTLKHVENYYVKATNNLYELKILFAQMVEFTHDVPPVLEQSQFEETLDKLLVYFDSSTGLHDQFLDTIHFWVDKASEVLASSKLGEGSENSIVSESFNTSPRGFPGLDSGASLDPGATSLVSTSDQLTANLAPQPTHQGTVTQPPTLTSDQSTPQLTMTQPLTADQQLHGVTGADTSQGFKTTTVSDVGNKLQLQGGSQGQGTTIGGFTGARSKITAPVKFTDNLFNTITDPNNRNVSLKGYSKFTPSQSKDNFTVNTPKKSEVMNAFSAGIRSNVISSSPGKSAFLPPAPFNSQAGAQPTFKPHQSSGQLVSSHQPPTLQHSSGTQLHQSHLPSDKPTDISKGMPRILQLELTTLTSDIERLRQKISALQMHATNLGNPNEQTNSTLREYSKDVSKLTDRSSRLFDRFDEKIDIPTRNVMENVFTNASNLSESLANIHHICSTDLLKKCAHTSVKCHKMDISGVLLPGSGPS